MKVITLETIYKKVVDLQRDIGTIKRSLIEEPELREDFISRMRDIDTEKSVVVKDFGRRYGLK
jgi:c-di-GMP-binding flagellar brake protein YcgR